MALIICPECKKKFSDKASQCPECGCPINYCLNSDVNNKEVVLVDSDKISALETKKIELLDQMIAEAESYEVTQKSIVHTFLIDNWEFTYSDADKLFLFLYSTFHEKIDVVLKRYEKSFALEVKAIDKLELTAAEKTIETCIKSHGEVDPVPFANRVLYRISDFRSDNADVMDTLPAHKIDTFMHDAFEDAVDEIVKTLDEDQQIAPSIDVYHKFLAAYLKRNYEWICEEPLYDIKEYVNKDYKEDMPLLKIVQDKYSLGDCWGVENPFSEYVNFYSDSSDTILERAIDEIRWRKKYMEKPDDYKLPERLAEKTEQLILYVIQKINEKFEFGMNPVYYDWETYQDARRKAAAFKTIKDEERKRKVLQKSFLEFPFNKNLYVELFKEYGNQNGQMPQLLETLDMDAEKLKNEAFRQLVDEAYSKVNWGNVDTINEAYETVCEKKKFLECDEFESDNYKRIMDDYHKYASWESLVQEKGKEGIAEVCDLLITQTDFITKNVSEKMKKGLNISDNAIVYCTYDGTLLGSGKRGFAITDRGIYVRQMLQKPVFYSCGELAGENHTYKISQNNILMDDKLILYFSYDSEITNKLYIAAKVIVPLIAALAGEQTKEQEAQIAVADGEQMKEQKPQIFCQFCGKKILAESNFCKYCGEKNTYKME